MSNGDQYKNTPVFAEVFLVGRDEDQVIGVAAGLRLKRGVGDALGNNDDVELRYGLVLGVSDTRNVQSAGTEECGELAEVEEPDHVST